jgi:adenosine deaminase
MHHSLSPAVLSGGLKEIRRIPKADLHNHCLMGARIGRVEKICGYRLERFHPREGSIHELNSWIGKVFRPLLIGHPGIFRKVVEEAFIQAKADGVTVLEMSIDAGYASLFRIAPREIVATLRNAHQTFAPEIDYRPEIGFIRGLSIRKHLANLEPFLDFDFFRSVDLYDDEFAQPVKNFRELFRFARRLGMKCKAHAGEFGDAESVREAVEVLELDAVQHGIAAASSPEVMRWLAQNKVQLNVCPASNIRLKRTRSYRTHPLKILFDHGIKVTVNTDDVMIFDAGVSEQFRRLHATGRFSSQELEQIRQNGLS